jgi:hypothetical protein
MSSLEQFDSMPSQGIRLETDGGCYGVAEVYVMRDAKSCKSARFYGRS